MTEYCRIIYCTKTPEAPIRKQNLTHLFSHGALTLISGTDNGPLS